MSDGQRLTVVQKEIKKYRDLHKAALDLRDDLLMRATNELNNDGSTCKVVDVSQGRWYMFNQALDKLKERK